jgi:hypothetical protein
MNKVDVRAKLAELGLELPVAAKPVAAYVPAIRTGNLVFTAGQLPLANGEMVGVGKVDEAFVERMKRGDIFVLGGQKFLFLYTRGMKALEFLKTTYEKSDDFLPKLFRNLSRLCMVDLATTVIETRIALRSRYIVPAVVPLTSLA